MTDINTYRARIGLFNPKLRKQKFLYKTEYYKTFNEKEDQSGRITLSILQFLFKCILFLGLLYPASTESGGYRIAGRSGYHTSVTWGCVTPIVHSGVQGGHGYCGSVGWSVVGVYSGYHFIREGGRSMEIVDHNFNARYINGNIQKKKGILNMHLNIRSLRYKVYEVKQVIKEHNPTLIGISECELYKDRMDEKCLKIPGYNILFPKSWESHGTARVVVYVKKTFKYEHLPELEDDCVQSVWIKGSQRNSKEMYFCHAYREHLTGQSVAAERDYLATWSSGRLLSMGVGQSLTRHTFVGI